jgi:hypothetical protein
MASRANRSNGRRKWQQSGNQEGHPPRKADSKLSVLKELGAEGICRHRLAIAATGSSAWKIFFGKKIKSEGVEGYEDGA